MKQFFKRTLSLFVTLCLVLPLSGAFVFASEDTLVFDGKAFCGTDRLLPFFYEEEGGVIVITDCLESVCGDAVIPAKIDGKPVKKIAKGAFEDCHTLSSLTLPESVTEIEEGAFGKQNTLRLCSVEGAFAETYAKENAIPFSVKKEHGDVDTNGKTNAFDVSLLAQYVAGWNVSVSQKKSDFNGDYEISAFDIAQLARHVAGWGTGTTFLLGDETACAEGFDGYYPALGWGEVLADALGTTNVKTLSFFGASAKNTISNPNYLTLLSEVREGDVVLLAFGRHDADSLAASYAPATGSKETPASFSYYLYEYYLLPLAARGAVPVLVTPLATRPSDGETFTENTLHGGYPAALKALAAETETPLLDLTRESQALYRSLPASENAYFNAWQTRDAESLSTEFLSVLGATQIAHRVAEELETLFPETFFANEAPPVETERQNYLTAFRATAQKTVFTYSDGTTSETDDTTISRDSYRTPQDESLVSVSFAEGVRAIAEGAFALQYDLESLGAALPSTLVSIGENAFHSCHNLWLDLLPERLAEIGNSAFYGCESLVITEIPQSVTHLGEYAFYGCDSIEGITFSASMESVPKAAFANCNALTSVDLSVFVDTIGESAFAGCEKIFEFSLPQELVSIGRRAFKDTGLSEIAVPVTLKELGAEAFYGCEDLDTLTYPLVATEWVAIEKGANWYRSTPLSLVNCFDGEVTVEGVILVDYHAYYSDFETALSDACAMTTEHADLTRHEKEIASAAILIEGGTLTIKLLKNADLFLLTTLSGDFTLDLRGMTIAFGTASSYFELEKGANVTVCDTVGGGKVYKHVDSVSAQYLYNLPNENSTLTITGGIHTCENNSGSSIAVRGMGKAGSKFHMSAGTLSATTNSSSASANAKAVQAPEYTEITGGALASKTVSGNSYTVSGVGTFVIRGGTFDSYTKYGNSMAFFAGSGTTPTDVVIYDGTFTTHANAINGKHIAFSTATGVNATIYNGTFTVDSKKTGDAGACGIGSAGQSLVIYDAFVQGNSAGLQALGVNTTIYGGTYIGADHGGAYFAHNGDVGTIAVLGGTFRFFQPEWQGSTSGTGSAYFTGGGKIYIDSATFEGRQVSISNLAGTSEETTVYISRTTAPSWRVDSLHTVYFGRDMQDAQITGNGTANHSLFASTVFDAAYLDSIR